MPEVRHKGKKGNPGIRESYEQERTGNVVRGGKIHPVQRSKKKFGGGARALKKGRTDGPTQQGGIGITRIEEKGGAGRGEDKGVRPKEEEHGFRATSQDVNWR